MRTFPRPFLLFAAAAAVLACLRLSPAIAAETAHRPNILFIFADDWGHQASAYRPFDRDRSLSQFVQTPNFDRVAREGVLFRNAFVNAPSCTPCRSSIISGQYFWRTHLGAILLGAQWDPAIPTFPILLKEKGYHIGYSYKVWGPGTPANAPFTKAEAYMQAGGDINHFSQVVTKAADKEAKKREIFAQVAGNFQQFLAARKADQPWCFWFGPTETHRKFEHGSGKAL